MRTFRLLWVAFLLCLPGWAVAELAVPVLHARVTDLTGSLSPAQQAALEVQLRDAEMRSGSQIAVLLVPTTQAETIEAYSIRVVEAWKLGQQGRDNGVLILIAKNDKRIRIEVGYGLEGVIPDALAKRLIDDLIAPRFKQGDYAGGVAAGVQGIVGLIDGRAAAQSVPAPRAVGVEAEPGAIAIPVFTQHVNDHAGVIPQNMLEPLEARLAEYERERALRINVLILPSCQPETLARFTSRALARMDEPDYDVAGRGVLFVLTSDDARAQIAVGHALQQLAPADAVERVLVEFMAPALGKRDFAGAVDAGIKQVQVLLDGGYMRPKQSFGDRVVAKIGELPWWLWLLVLIAGTALRAFIGPVRGGLVMGGLIGGSAWLVSGSPAVAGFAALVTFIFVVVGILNWTSLVLDSSSGSGGGSGFSGGGGSFGGGGASGSW